MLNKGPAQAIAVRPWWRKWPQAMRWTAPVLGAALVIGFGVLAYQRQHRQEQAQQAAGIYAEVMDALRQDQAIQALSHTKRLMENYAERAEASLAALATAPAALALQGRDAALGQLRFTVGHSKDLGIVADARLQLARLLWDDGHPQAALDILNNPAKGFEAHFFALRGDVLWAQGQGKAARDAWDQAMRHARDPGLRGELQQRQAVWP